MEIIEEELVRSFYHFLQGKISKTEYLGRVRRVLYENLLGEDSLLGILQEMTCLTRTEFYTIPFDEVELDIARNLMCVEIAKSQEITSTVKSLIKPYVSELDSLLSRNLVGMSDEKKREVLETHTSLVREEGVFGPVILIDSNEVLISLGEGEVKSIHTLPMFRGMRMFIPFSQILYFSNKTATSFKGIKVFTFAVKPEGMRGREERLRRYGDNLRNKGGCRGSSSGSTRKGLFRV